MTGLTLVVRQADLPRPDVPALPIICCRCESRCWISPAGLELARFLGTAAVCRRCFATGEP